MWKWFIKHQWYGVRRSPVWNRSVASNIFIGILFFLMGLNFLSIGLFLDKLLIEINPGADHIDLFCGYLLFYLMFDLLLRLVLQKIHGLTIQPYLHLPIKDSSLINYLLSKSFLSFFNFFPFLIIIPFVVNILVPTTGGVIGFVWLIFFFLFLINNSLLNVYISRVSFGNPKVAIFYSAIIILLAVLESQNVISLTKLSSEIFTSVLNEPLFVLLPVVFTIILYSLNYNFLKGKLYGEELNIKKVKNEFEGKNLNFLSRFGELGTLLQIEFKMLFRNKRPRSTLIFSLVFLLFGFLAYGVERYNSSHFFFIYFSIMLTGMLMLTYGQFLLSWESCYFDGILAQKIDMIKYLKTKYIIMIVFAFTSFILVAPYAFFGISILYQNFALMLYNMGINSIVLMFLATLARKRVDLNVSVMSMQGKGGAQFITFLPTMIGPILIFLPVYSFWGPTAGFLFLGGLGLLAILFHNFLIRWMLKLFTKKKYIMAAAFRESY